MYEISAKELLFSGGPVMIPLAICSILGLGIILNRWLYFIKSQANSNLTKLEVFNLIRANKIKEAILFCETQTTPIAQILKAGLLKSGASREEIKEELEQVSALEIPKLENGLAALITIANITPLLGMFGTVLGLTITFHAIQSHSSGTNPLTPADLAGGIWQALLTTLMGLAVAIPCFAAYNYFVQRINDMITEMEKTARDLLNLLASPEEYPKDQIIETS